MSFDKPKKYVFHLTPENAQYFQHLEQSQRHGLINEIIEKHYKRKVPITDNKILKLYLKYMLIGFAIVFIAIPLFIGIIRLAFSSTKANYDYFTSGFVQYDKAQKQRR